MYPVPALILTETAQAKGSYGRILHMLRRQICAPRRRITGILRAYSNRRDPKIAAPQHYRVPDYAKRKFVLCITDGAAAGA
jgi:hypothetical protein